ncbi:hypothetical protein [Microbispora sp. ATCC PTA-5024]|uniref:hypothetical protein n=1 Tax=Microbispora sp. ATCC PTA-5024 TaxID=316330 RepID=UPI0003DCBC9F|nr:hypothetical protein [Microbispora sp. ATCC PTA-5024]ETK32085.1 hypothetical protein MPTA5024_31555 [Microbispora sp. ATCC PTA-5024]
MRTLALVSLIGASASAVFLAALDPLPAAAGTDRERAARAHGRLRADPPGDDTVTSGNGRRNRSVLSVKSPTNNRGYQHTSTEAADGVTSVQNALCRRSRVCNITQNVTVIAPTPRPTPTPAATPTPSPTPTPSEEPVQAVSEPQWRPVAVVWPLIRLDVGLLLRPACGCVPLTVIG